MRRSSWRLRPQGSGFQSGADFGGSVVAIASATRLVSGDFSSVDTRIDIRSPLGRGRAVLRVESPGTLACSDDAAKGSDRFSTIEGRRAAGSNQRSQSVNRRLYVLSIEAM
jgi:hypothetical protein